MECEVGAGIAAVVTAHGRRPWIRLPVEILDAAIAAERTSRDTRCRPAASAAPWIRLAAAALPAVPSVLEPLANAFNAPDEWAPGRPPQVDRPHGWDLATPSPNAWWWSTAAWRHPSGDPLHALATLNAALWSSGISARAEALEIWLDVPPELTSWPSLVAAQGGVNGQVTVRVDATGTVTFVGHQHPAVVWATTALSRAVDGTPSDEVLDARTDALRQVLDQLLLTHVLRRSHRHQHPSVGSVDEAVYAMIQRWPWNHGGREPITEVRRLRLDCIDDVRSFVTESRESAPLLRQDVSWEADDALVKLLERWRRELDEQIIDPRIS